MVQSQIRKLEEAWPHGKCDLITNWFHNDVSVLFLNCVN